MSAAATIGNTVPVVEEGDGFAIDRPDFRFFISVHLRFICGHSSWCCERTETLKEDWPQINADKRR